MWRDLRYAAQALKRSPAFTLSATLALGLAIGANATIFGLVDGLWFRPPGVRAPLDLVRVFSTTPTSSEAVWSFPEYQAIAAGVSNLDGAVAKGGRGATMADADGRSELLLVNVVSTNFFAVLGVRAGAGRLFAPEDGAALEAQPAVVLGHAFWRRRFGGDPAVVGSTIHLGRGAPIAMTVLGVLPGSFRDLDAAGDRDVWMTPEGWTRLTNRREFEDRAMRWFQVIARRRAGASVGAVQSEVTALASALARDFPATNRGRGARVIADLDYRLKAGGATALALIGLVLLVVLITCVNLANLLLARAAARARELAVRAALGASRWRMLRQMLAECVLIGALGALVGLTIAVWLIRLLPAILVPPPGFRSLLVFQADARVFAFTLGVTLLTTVLFGLAPGWLVAWTDVAPLIKGESRLKADDRADRRIRSAMVVGQTAVSLVLLTAACLLSKSFVATGRADIGISRTPILTAWITARDERSASSELAVARLSALPGVSSVAVAIRAPLSRSGNGIAQEVSIPGAARDPSVALPEVKYNAVSANYFSTMGVRVIRGRVFGEEDQRNGERVVVVSERFASRFFPGSDALGQVVALGAAAVPHSVIGIVRDAVINEIDEAPEPYMYLPYWRGEYTEITYLVGTSVPASQLGGAVREALKRTDPALQPDRVITMAEYIDYSAGAYRATAALAVALGAVGLLLTAIGVYGVIAYRTSKRRREIGIRVALGAERRIVIGLVFREGARLAVAGLAIGLPAALAASRLISSLLFGVRPWDAASLSLAAAVLAAAVSLAILIPAWRATRVMPSEALRDV